MKYTVTGLVGNEAMGAFVAKCLAHHDGAKAALEDQTAEALRWACVDQPLYRESEHFAPMSCHHGSHH